MPEGGNRVIDGDLAFPFGSDCMLPKEGAQGASVIATNTLARGAVWQTRPGYEQKLNLPSGRLQGGFLFKPTEGEVSIVFFVDGQGYTSAYPFNEHTEVPGLTISSEAKYAFFAQTVQSVKRNPDLSLTLIEPKALLIIQDGLSRAKTWDGSTATAEAGIPVGTHMLWTGDRLWVARGRKLFAGDIADPTSFFEGQYINSVGSFLLPDECTGLAEVSTAVSPFLIAFTARTGTAVQSNIRNRTLWETTPDFVKLIFPSIGCVAHQSIVNHNGLLWWFAAHGVTNIDFAYQSQTSGVLSIVDGPMSYSKRYLAPDISGMAAASFENYLLLSVPYCDVYNRHTWVLDTGMTGTNRSTAGAWNGHWTGTRPFTWLYGVVDGMARVYQLSVDRDGGNRLWEAFKADRNDNGCPISCSVLTRQYSADKKALKRLAYGDFFFEECFGNVDVAVLAAAGVRGPFYQVAQKRIVSTKGSIDASIDLSYQDDVFAYKPQSRIVRTGDLRMEDDKETSSCDVEWVRNDDNDFSFQFCVRWNGEAALTSNRIFCIPEGELRQGKCEEDEDGIRAVRFDGHGIATETKEEAIDALTAVETQEFTGAAAVSASYRGVTVVGSATATSTISQLTADKLAECIAEMRAAKALERNAPAFIGGGAFGCPDTIIETN